MASNDGIPAFDPSESGLHPENSLDGQQIFESLPDVQHPSQIFRLPLRENLAAGNSGCNFTPQLQWEMSQSSVQTPIDFADMSLEPQLMLGEGQSYLSIPNEENISMLKSGVGSESGIMDCPLMAPPHFSMNGIASVEAPLPRMTWRPALHLSRPRQPKKLNISSKRHAIPRRNSIMQGHGPKLHRIPPTRLLKHLQNEFQSNDNISDDFRHSAMSCLKQLDDVIGHEKQHGSPAARKFLSGEDDVIATPSFFDSSENSSPSLPQLLNTPMHTPSFIIHSEDISDTSTLKPFTEEPSTQFITSTSKTIYYCTRRKCSQQFKTRADWTRHEKIKSHWMQERYMCPKCAITEISPQALCCRFCSYTLSSVEDAKTHCLNCHEVRSRGKTFPRKDKFGHHLRVVHGLPGVSDEMETWIYDIDGDWPRQCGFCGKVFNDWEERAGHIEEHFKAGDTMKKYKYPFPTPTDSEMQYSYSHRGKDNDDDEYGGGGGGDWFHQSPGGMLPPQGHNPGWPGNGSAPGGFGPAQGGSNSMNNGTQYSHALDIATPQTNLIPYKAQPAFRRTNLLSEISSTSKNSRYHTNNYPKSFNNLLPIINTHHLLIFALSLLTSHPIHPKTTKLLFAFLSLLRHPNHNRASFIHEPDSIHRIITPLLAQDSYRFTTALAQSLVGSSGNGRWAITLSYGTKHGGHQRHRRQKSWERRKMRNGAAAAVLEREFERVLVLGGEVGGMRL